MPEHQGLLGGITRRAFVKRGSALALLLSPAAAALGIAERGAAHSHGGEEPAECDPVRTKCYHVGTVYTGGCVSYVYDCYDTITGKYCGSYSVHVYEDGKNS